MAPGAFAVPVEDADVRRPRLGVTMVTAGTIAFAAVPACAYESNIWGMNWNSTFDSGSNWTKSHGLLMKLAPFRFEIIILCPLSSRERLDDLTAF